MLSYRHAFHAGNAPDVLKHGVLLYCLGYLQKKEKPLLCIDTHGGAGYYDLTQGYAAQNREWEQGIAPLLRESEEALPPLVRSFAALVREHGWPESPAGIRRYPGSPAIMAALLRPRDRAVCFELHPADFALLREHFRGNPRLRILREDGFAALKSLLPPPSRRALVFIDPPYETKNDYRLLPKVLKDALDRFPQGTYIIWYPLLGKEGKSRPGEHTGLPEQLWSLYRGNRLRAELYAGGEGLTETRGLRGSGLVIYNPPWTLKDALEESLPVLARLLGGKTNPETGKPWDLQHEAGPVQP